jgi:hypothetical protein
MVAKQHSAVPEVPQQLALLLRATPVKGCPLQVGMDMLAELI